MSWVNDEKPLLVIHGGAGTWKNIEDLSSLKKVLEESLAHGIEEAKNGNCIDMVTEAIRVMEDSNILNAGLGSTLDFLGNITMDSGIINGKTGKAGAVAAVTYPKNPIKLARYVLEKTPHLLLAGQYADELAKKIKLERHPGPSQRSLELWRRLKYSKDNVQDKFVLERINAAKSIGFDTVGAVALDNDNCLSAGVSTGGVSLKLPGRVGDSPIMGAGFYANKKIAVAATGIGEIIILSLLSYNTAIVYESYNSISEAFLTMINRINASYSKDTVGMIGLDYKGNIGAIYNTEAMPWGFANNKRKIEIHGLPRQ
ncbi:MAG: asparaginase [Caldisphaera sp.]|jgi:beta-aspartyl-peptidase (threonine type)|nr:isoaspartyl peptidase/L-asparaginase [Caldisphaera sp.]PMP91812.1 MAG: asparaginase [Caldisphaera sp.]